MVGVTVILVEDEDVFLCGSLFERRRDAKRTTTTTKAKLESRTEDDAKDCIDDVDRKRYRRVRR